MSTRRVQLDAEIMVYRSEVVAEGGFRKMMPTILADLRETAERRAREVNGKIVPTIKPDIVISEGIDPKVGEDCYMFASRWTIDVPENADIRPER